MALIADTPNESTRVPGDDFFCLRYRVWYRSIDCAYRTRFETCAGCARCDQGRFNLARHASSLVLLRPSRDRAGA